MCLAVIKSVYDTAASNDVVGMQSAEIVTKKEATPHRTLVATFAL